MWIFNAYIKKYLSGAQEWWDYFSDAPERRFWAIWGVVWLLVVVITGASSWATPGNALYPIKVHVWERVGSFLALTNSQQAERTRVLSGNRLDEAARLLTGGGSQAKDSLLTLRNLFEAVAAKENSMIEGVQKNKNIAEAVTLANRYEADLKGFEKVFLKIRQAYDAAPDQMDSLGVALDAEITKIKNVRTTLEASLRKDEGNVLYQNQAESTVDEAKDIIKMARESLAEKKKVRGEGAAASSESELKIAEGLMAHVQIKIDAKTYGTALVVSNEAYRLAKAEAIFLNF